VERSSETLQTVQKLAFLTRAIAKCFGKETGQDNLSKKDIHNSSLSTGSPNAQSSFS
jgi:hypothetical protein